MHISLNRSRHNGWAALLSLWTLHGVIALLQFAGTTFLHGFSLPRLIVIGLLFFWVAFCVALIFSIFQNNSWWAAWQRWINGRHAGDVFFLTSLCVILSWLLGAILRSLAGRQLLHYFVFIDQLAPIINLLAWVALEMAILLLFSKLRGREEYENYSPIILGRLLMVLTVLGLIGFTIYRTGLGLAQAYEGDWSRGLPAVPLLEWQIILACLFCLSVLVIESKNKTAHISHLDLWVCALIWAGTVIFWLSHPILPGPSALKPHEPNFEVYPFTDAQTYDQLSQSVLVGNGFGESRIPQRPLYIVFLVFLHVLAGESYNGMILLQTLIFAMFPVLLYLFGREFFGRPLGISIALLAIFRDYTSNLVAPFTGNLSYSKLLLSEIPTAMLLILLLLVGMRWIKSGFPVFLGFLLGGILGAAMLIRTQSMAILAVIVLFALLVQSKKFMLLTKSLLLAALGGVLVVSPWLWRNWQVSGELMFDSPESMMNLALRYNRLNGAEVDIMPRPEESHSAYNDRLLATALDAITLNPQGAAMGVVNFFLNHVVNNILLFPLRDDLQDFRELWLPTSPFWEEWKGTPNRVQGLIIIFYAFLFGLGVTAAWVRNGWLGLMPLSLNLIYNLWTSLALLSGQRFMLTMDWSVYMYYMIGLFALLSCLLYCLDGGRGIIVRWYQNNSFSMTQPALKTTSWHYLLTGMFFLGIGLSLILVEKAFPERYPFASRAVILQDLASSRVFDEADLSPACLAGSVGKYDLNIWQGKVLYPRYYGAGDGEDFTDAVGYGITDQSRLVFEMIGQFNGRVIFPMGQSPDFFPNASDATIFLDDHGEPWFVFVRLGDVERLYVSGSFDKTLCE